MNSTAFHNAFRNHFNKLAAAGPLFVVDVTKEELWDTYLGAFENDPIFKTRRMHDCSTCRHFIYNLGKLVSIKNGVVTSVWHFDVPGEPEYTAVARAMDELILSKPVVSVYKSKEAKYGVASNRSMIDGKVHTFHHFHADVPAQHRGDDTLIGRLNTQQQMLLRAINEVKIEAIDDVLELIESNALYRGAEFKDGLKAYQKLLKNAPPPAYPIPRVDYSWEHHAHPAARMRNTAIGTLLVDLSEGRDLESAVKAYETIMAPANYKRPTALVTPKMVEQAKKKVAELGLESALQRRYANLTDVSVNDVLFADRDAKKQLKDSVFDELPVRQPKQKLDRAVPIAMDKFLSDVVPTAETIEVYFENKHASRLVSLVTAVDPNAPQLFQWNNHFSWSYNGDVTDAIKEHVKAKGGNVTGELCCRLAWNNYDDLDFHMIEPNQYIIYYGNRNSRSFNGGKLDVDANAGGGSPSRGTREPVENIYYERCSDMMHGTYLLRVHQFALMETKDNDFTVQIDLNGEVTELHGTNPKPKQYIAVANIIVDKTGVHVKPIMPAITPSRTLWGLDTQTFHRVSALLRSPNHWEGTAKKGNEHYFFMLNGCVNDDNARGFYNEFLRPDLTEHRKVLELVGSKTRTQETPDQLSGLGFSSTSNQSITVRVTGKGTTRLFTLTI